MIDKICDDRKISFLIDCIHRKAEQLDHGLDEAIYLGNLFGMKNFLREVDIITPSLSEVSPFNVITGDSTPSRLHVLSYEEQVSCDNIELKSPLHSMSDKSLP